MDDQQKEPPAQAAEPKPPPSLKSSQLAGMSSRSARLCDNAGDPCQMCKEIANIPIARSDELLQGQRELLIIHGNQIYRLLRTRSDKLILQK
jgi:hemin uptake protein HemP